MTVSNAQESWRSGAQTMASARTATLAAESACATKGFMAHPARPVSQADMGKTASQVGVITEAQ